MSAQTIIVADDTNTFRNMLSERLEEKGFSIIQACDGLEALKVVNDTYPNVDLLVLDLLMPKMLGFDVLKKIRDNSKTKELPVFVITGLFKTIDDIKKLKDLGANGFVDKGQSLDEIAFRIENLLKSKDTETEDQSSMKFKLAESFQVYYTYEDKEDAGYTYTLSNEGMYLRAKEPPPVDSKISLNFSLPNDEENGPEISARAKVVKVVTKDDKQELLLFPEGMEVDFLDLTKGQKKAIGEFIKDQLINHNKDK